MLMYIKALLGWTFARSSLLLVDGISAFRWSTERGLLYAVSVRAVTYAAPAPAVHHSSVYCDLCSTSAVIAHHSCTSRALHFSSACCKPCRSSACVVCCTCVRCGVHVSSTCCVMFRSSAGNVCCTIACRELTVAAHTVYTAQAAVVKYILLSPPLSYVAPARVVYAAQGPVCEVHVSSSCSVRSSGARCCVLPAPDVHTTPTPIVEFMHHCRP